MNRLITGTTLNMPRSHLVRLRNSILNGNAEGFQKHFTAFLQKRLSLFCVLSHKEKVYQSLCFMLFLKLFMDDPILWRTRLDQNDFRDSFGR